MELDLKGVPLNADLLYVYLLNKDLFPIGHKGSPEQFLEIIDREHKQRGGVPSLSKQPLRELTSCLKLLRSRGYYKRRFRNMWERISFRIPKKIEHSAAASVAALTTAAISSSIVS
ncbi:MAG: hypothetical protein F4Z01_08270 [Gammaproteobacteria bacterium]|nr:hypothetical protein [Gammaproteobacteria bacterium]MYF37153.1 hypothetical protein [Gammaproteobacteria bacterium]